MELTGKCKEDFEKWFKDKYMKLDSSFCNRFFNDRIFTPDIMKFGVYLDFFDIKDIRIEIQVQAEPTMQGARFKCYRPEILVRGRFINCGASFGERSRAQISAIEKANELYNNQP